MRQPRRSMTWAVSRIQEPTVRKLFPSNPIAGGWFWVWILVVASGGCCSCCRSCWNFGTQGRGKREVSDTPLTTRYFTFFSENLTPLNTAQWVGRVVEVISLPLPAENLNMGFVFQILIACSQSADTTQRHSYRSLLLHRHSYSSTLLGLQFGHGGKLMEDTKRILFDSWVFNTILFYKQNRMGTYVVQIRTQMNLHRLMFWCSVIVKRQPLRTVLTSQNLQRHHLL